ncbi:expressed unknown protein [Seminavis robusta]|uniref:Feruloyl esterase n=1 Tax=Seminavis robusta TaxID=568900 RepID=A0A9N8DDV7_9STRA|nr:expressed unknown protein [Seminavis robusta]|eukprot:Sro73_g040380.1 n/a (409) ;mRNA; f:70619-71845
MKGPTILPRLGVYWALLSQLCHGRSLNTDCSIDDAALQNDLLEDQEASVSKVCFPVRGAERCFFLLLPECAKEKSNVPLVVDLHDTGSCPLAQSRISGWKEYALSECFAVSWPLGTTDPNVADEPCFTVPGGMDVLNSHGRTVGVAPDCCCKKGGQLIPETDTNDIEFLHDVINKAIDEAWYRNVAINATKVQLSGYGNGATAAMGFTAIHSDIVSCLSPFAGPMVTAIPEDYTPVPVFSVLDSGRSHQDQELDSSTELMLSPGDVAYILPSPSRVDEVFSEANHCVGESTSRSNTATDKLTQVEGVVTSGKFGDCKAPVNFLKPPFAAYKSRISTDDDTDTTSTAAKNRVVDTTIIAYMFCKDRHSVDTDYVRVERPPVSAAATTKSALATSVVAVVSATVALWTAA